MCKIRLTKLVLFSYFFFAISQNVSTLFKLTNMQCESFNKSWAVFNECRLRAIKRDVTVCKWNTTNLHPVYKMETNFAILKKASGYKPFVVNVTVDICAFFRKRNNPLFPLILDQIKDFSNINHTCPYEGHYLIQDYYPRADILKLPLPDGEYLLLVTWFFHSKKIGNTKFYFTFSMN